MAAVCGCSGLSVNNSHRLLPQSYLNAAYSGGSTCECGVSVNNSHSLQPQNYLHATYSGGSICKSGLLVHRATSNSCGGICETC